MRKEKTDPIKLDPLPPVATAEAKALYETLYDICKGRTQHEHGDIKYATWFDLDQDNIVIEVENVDED